MNGGHDVRDYIQKSEIFTQAAYFVLIKGQICAEWFMFRQIRVTGTVFGVILLTYSTRMSIIGHGTSNGTPTQIYYIQMLVDSWFLTFRSTEEIMRGMDNETLFLPYLMNNILIKDLYKCRMIGMKDYP